MKPTIAGSTGWTVDIDEVSAGVYKLVAKNKYGCRIEDTGIDPDALLEKAKSVAHKMDADIAQSLKDRNQQQDREDVE